MSIRIGIPDMISPSYFPAIAAVELGHFEDQGLDASVELLYPVTDTYEALRDEELDYVGGAAHAPLYVFEDWDGCQLVGALSQNMYWFLVVRSDLDAERGDLEALKGLEIGAAPGPVDGLRQMLRAAGIDPESDLDIVPVPGTDGESVSFGVTAAEALEDGKIDGFWANGMGAEVAVRNGSGEVLVDARRGDGPAGAEDYTFPALVTTEGRVDEDPDEVAGAVRALAAAQRALAEDPSLATEAARDHFPEYELGLIEEVVERDTPFYDPSISEEKVDAMNAFARDLGVLDAEDVAYDDVVATQFRTEWD